MLASRMALVSAKNSFTPASMPRRPVPWWSRRETYWANRSQWPGGSSVWGPSGPVLGDHLLLVGQVGADAEQRQRLVAVGGAAVPGGPGARAQRRAGRQREPGDVPPVRGDVGRGDGSSPAGRGSAAAASGSGRGRWTG